MTKVTAELMNSVLGKVLKLIMNNIGTIDAPWMNRIASEWQNSLNLMLKVKYTNRKIKNVLNYKIFKTTTTFISLLVAVAINRR